MDRANTFMGHIGLLGTILVFSFPTYSENGVGASAQASQAEDHVDSAELDEAIEGSELPSLEEVRAIRPADRSKGFSVLAYQRLMRGAFSWINETKFEGKRYADLEYPDNAHKKGEDAEKFFEAAILCLKEPEKRRHLGGVQKIIFGDFNLFELRSDTVGTLTVSPRLYERRIVDGEAESDESLCDRFVSFLDKKVPLKEDLEYYSADGIAKYLAEQLGVERVHFSDKNSENHSNAATPSTDDDESVNSTETQEENNKEKVLGFLKMLDECPIDLETQGADSSPHAVNMRLLDTLVLSDVSFWAEPVEEGAKHRAYLNADMDCDGFLDFMEKRYSPDYRFDDFSFGELEEYLRSRFGVEGINYDIERQFIADALRANREIFPPQEKWPFEIEKHDRINGLVRDLRDSTCGGVYAMARDAQDLYFDARDSFLRSRIMTLPEPSQAHSVMENANKEFQAANGALEAAKSIIGRMNPVLEKCLKKQGGRLSQEEREILERHQTAARSLLGNMHTVSQGLEKATAKPRFPVEQQQQQEKSEDEELAEKLMREEFIASRKAEHERQRQALHSLKLAEAKRVAQQVSVCEEIQINAEDGGMGIKAHPDAVRSVTLGSFSLYNPAAREATIPTRPHGWDPIKGADGESLEKHCDVIRGTVVRTQADPRDFPPTRPEDRTAFDWGLDEVSTFIQGETYYGVEGPEGRMVPFAIDVGFGPGVLEDTTVRGASWNPFNGTLADGGPFITYAEIADEEERKLLHASRFARLLVNYRDMKAPEAMKSVQDVLPWGDSGSPPDWWVRLNNFANVPGGRYRGILRWQLDNTGVAFRDSFADDDNTLNTMTSFEVDQIRKLDGLNADGTFTVDVVTNMHAMEEEAYAKEHLQYFHYFPRLVSDSAGGDLGQAIMQRDELGRNIYDRISQYKQQAEGLIADGVGSRQTAESRGLNLQRQAIFNRGGKSGSSSTTKVPTLHLGLSTDPFEAQEMLIALNRLASNSSSLRSSYPNGVDVSVFQNIDPSIDRIVLVPMLDADGELIPFDENKDKVTLGYWDSGEKVLIMDPRHVDSIRNLTIE